MSTIVYAYYDKTECFYIGIGKPGRERQHQSDRRNKFTHRKILKAKAQGSFHIQILHSNISWKMACWYERMYIKNIGRRDLNTGTLTNLTDGGEYTTNVSPITKEKIRQSKLGSIPWNKGLKGLKGHPGSNKQKQAVSNAAKNRVWTKEQRQKVSQRFQGVLPSNATAINTPYGKYKSIESANRDPKVKESKYIMRKLLKDPSQLEWTLDRTAVSQEM